VVLGKQMILFLHCWGLCRAEERRRDVEGRCVSRAFSSLDGEYRSPAFSASSFLVTPNGRFDIC